MTEIPETPDSTEPQRDSTGETAGVRGQDDRRGEVDPAENPAPHSPEPDKEAIRLAEEALDRIKPY